MTLGGVSVTRTWWWEKTVEHLYVRRILSDAALSIPLDGDVETGVGDLIRLTTSAARS